MYTSLFVLALAVPVAASAEDSTPALKWQDSYRTAQKVCREQDKPLAVFIGSGPMAWKHFIEEGELSAKARNALADGYVCVYLDREQAAGKRLVEQFDTPTGSAIVFSTRDGQGQAFYHAGKLTAAEFRSRVTRYAGTEVVSTTETLNDSRTSFSYDPKAKSPVMKGSVAPPINMGTYPGHFGTAVPFPSNFGSFGGYRGNFGGGFGGGCPNCRR